MKCRRPISTAFCSKHGWTLMIAETQKVYNLSISIAVAVVVFTPEAKSQTMRKPTATSGKFKGLPVFQVDKVELFPEKKFVLSSSTTTSF